MPMTDPLQYDPLSAVDREIRRQLIADMLREDGCDDRLIDAYLRESGDSRPS